MIIKETIKIAGKEIGLETGRIARQAGGAVLVTLEDTVVLVTAVSSHDPRDVDFFPLTCDFFEKAYAGGKIPGGFFKREAKQRDEEILVCRLMDRPIRPMFPEGFHNDTQVVATLLSADRSNKPDVLAVTGASAALHLSSIPFDGPLAAVRVGRVAGSFIAFPTMDDLEKSDLDVVVAATRDAIVMVEGGSDEISEADLIDALEFGHKCALPLIELQEEMRKAVGKAKWAVTVPKKDEKVAARVTELFTQKVDDATRIRVKQERYGRIDELKKEVKASLAEEFPEQAKDISEAFSDLKKKIVRTRILKKGERIDGRGLSDIRPITCEVGILPRVHGTGLFTRGETQGLVTATLGVVSDEQRLDGLYNPEGWKKFMLHYNFPPYSVGEVKPMRGPGRREIGHGALAERSIAKVLPANESFPYTIRIVSEITESNGSSSMATVCGSSLALMDAGVPIKAPVAGIAMGLIKEDDDIAVLSDILGDEDHLGDMDFKVTGTAKGINAVQMDIKCKGLSRDIMVKALEQARQGRLHILGEMAKTLAEPRPELSKHAPRITTIKVRPDQIRIIIGPGGKMIKGIVDQTGVDINVEDDGTVHIASSDSAAVAKALEIINGLTREATVGEIYEGTVARIADFGAFVNILPGTDGLVHISELDWRRVERVEDVCKEGETMRVKVIGVESDSGKIRLSRKELLEKPEGWEERPPRDQRDGGGRGDRNDRGPRRSGGDRPGGPPRSGRPDRKREG
ncbi:MAG: polyribonucleotide nucleotidyltransferase [Myxococcota bacterium]|jgi:polyribonucleotide nucleotidyltransferase|nr:polyribonucleotide nucleotidyltransferase [Myxococcota bacterium]